MAYSKTHAHIFDFDGTLIPFNSSLLFAHFLYKKKIIPWNRFSSALFFYAKHRYLNRISLQQLHQKAFDLLLKHVSMDVLSELAIDFWKTKPRPFYSPLLKYFQEAKENEEISFLMTRSPDFLVRPALQKLGVYQYFATHYSVDEERRLKGIDLLVDTNFKVSVAKRLMEIYHIKKEQLIIYSDSMDDLPLLQLSCRPVVVNPGYCLKKIAKRLNWIML